MNRIVPLMLLVAASQVACKQMPEIELAREGQAAAPIVLAEGATLPERTAAEELKHYLDEMTGGEFAIVSESEWGGSPDAANAPAILVGPTAAARQAGVDLTEDEGWTVLCEGNRLILAGGRPRGTLYAVWHFLEEDLGVRWFTPWEEHVPSRPDIALAADRRSGVPAFDFRHLHVVVTPRGERLFTGRDGRFPARLRLSRWGAMDIDPKYGYDYGYNTFPVPWVAHTLIGSILQSDLSKVHPEWFALQGRRRVNNSPCLTNAALLTRIEQRLREIIESEFEKARREGRPPRLVYNLSGSDVHITRCDCPVCRAAAGGVGGNAEVTVQAMNALAERLSGEYPDVRLETLAYYDTETPAKTPAHPSVIITLADTLSSHVFAADHPVNAEWARKLRAWSNLTEHLRLWLYGWSYAYLGEPPVPTEFTLPASYRLFEDLGLEGMMVQYCGYNAWRLDMWEMKLYLHAKLMEEPDADFDALMADWIEGYYGPGGPYVLAYREMLRDAALADPPPVTPLCKTDFAAYPYLKAGLIARANALLAQAADACAGDQTRLRRLRDVRRTLDYTTVLAHPLLMRRWLLDGKPWEDYPLDRRAAAERLKRAISEHSRFRFGEDFLESGHPFHASIVEDVLHRTELCLAMPENWDCPETLGGEPVEVLLEQVPLMGGTYGVKSTLAEDPLSVTGMTESVPLNTEGEVLLAGGVWHIPDTDRIAVSESIPVRRGDVPSAGYHWYKVFDDVTIAPGDRLYFAFPAWKIQYGLDSVHDPAEPDRRYDVWVSARFDGPDVPHGDPSRPRRACIDRVLVTAGGK